LFDFVKITLKPDVLKWARVRAGLDRESLAKKVLGKLGKPETVAEWETSGVLNYRQAEVLAEKTYTPFGYLFLHEPPKEELPIKDFRTVGTSGHNRPSAALIDVIFECQRRQAWYREYLLEQGADRLAYVGSASIQNPVESTASDIRNTIRVGGLVSASIVSWRENLSAHFDAAEEAGILVMRNGVVGNNGTRKLSVNEFRGFALSDPYAPLVFVNSRDAKAAQLFTLVHEIAHIWLGESALSNTEKTYAEGAQIERYCNAVAAEVLVPASDFRGLWNTRENPLREIGKLAGRYKVSTLVAARRARDLDLISKRDFGDFYERELARYFASEPKPKSSDEKSGNFHNTLRARASSAFCNALIASTLNGGTTYSQAFSLLGVKSTSSFNSFARAKFPHLLK
jgi:Zn-dependent peptidase ImmA (M78 family)